ncbi:hypothetical protein [Uliginosibacterium aquaticum]|uniref:Uncharacterized protein n=1 Tax=Uliginosibacterium aquaticum TaxID=2731212 RepID=A0ABX2IC68_9RHOO|nr:hypothetical protein [Uliginosibacterium aquaticum]NSL54076.1 hypothetical protein [Uliginosibacterium aquaticum]
MRSLRLPFLVALLCLAGQALPAHAQATGLRLKHTPESQQAGESGLRLSFSSFSAAGEVTAAQSSPLFDAASVRNSLRADYPLLAKGVHTSVGVSWNDLSASTSGQASSRSSQLAAVPFLGLSWQSSQARQNRWSLSAEVGTALAGNCSGMAPSCSGAPTTGLNPSSSGSGLRLNPYVNFGATFRFDQ